MRASSMTDKLSMIDFVLLTPQSRSGHAGDSTWSMPRHSVVNNSLKRINKIQYSLTLTLKSLFLVDSVLSISWYHAISLISS